MPLNRVHDAKAKIYWLQLLEQKQDDSGVPPFIPGLLLLPIPAAGKYLGKIDVGFWAAFLYVLGSILYVIDSFYLWGSLGMEATDDGTSPGSLLNIAACLVFILNVIACFVDWWLQVKQLSFMNIVAAEDESGRIELNQFSNWISTCYFFNNVFFLAAAVIYLIQGIWMVNYTTDLLGCSNTFCGVFWINFWGSMMYLLSSIFAVLEYFEDRRIRNQRGLRRMQLLSCADNMFDWFGWGDWLYLLSAIAELFQAIDAAGVNNDDNVISGCYMLSNVLFLVDSIAYFIGYVVYVLEIRNALVTGFVSANQMKEVNELLCHYDETHRESILDVNDNEPVRLEDVQNRFTEYRASLVNTKSFSRPLNYGASIQMSPMTHHIYLFMTWECLATIVAFILFALICLYLL